MSNEDGNGGLVKKKDARLDQELGNPTVYPSTVGPFSVGLGNIHQIESLKLQDAESFPVAPPLPIPDEVNLTWYYSADSPGTGNYPVDIGPNTLGTMTHIGTKPGWNATTGPNSTSAWGPFASAGFFKNAGSSTLYANGDYTVCVMFQMQPYAAGSHPYILGYDDTNNTFSSVRLEGGHFTNGGGSDSQKFTVSSNGGTEVDSGGPASPDTTWYILGMYKAAGASSAYTTFLGEVGELSHIDQGGPLSFTGNLGDEIRLGGQHDSFATQGMRGFIWKTMAWTGQVDPLDIYEWAKDQAGL